MKSLTNSNDEYGAISRNVGRASVRPYGTLEAFVDGIDFMTSVDLVLPAPGTRRAQRVQQRPRGPDDDTRAGERFSDGYTIQLMGTHDESTALRYIARHGIGQRATYFRSRYRGRPWYSVIYGRFSSKQAARRARNALPPELREASPWVRRISDIEGRMRGTTTTQDY
jgi:hypothetical protein